MTCYLRYKAFTMIPIGNATIFHVTHCYYLYLQSFLIDTTSPRYNEYPM